MSSQNISIDPDKAANAVRLVSRGQEATGSLEVHSKGVGVGATSGFRNMLTSWVLDTQKALTEIEAKLGDVHSKMTETVIELGEADSALAAQTATFQAGIADIPAPASSSSTGSGATAAPSSPKKTGIS